MGCMPTKQSGWVVDVGAFQYCTPAQKIKASTRSFCKSFFESPGVDLEIPGGGGGVIPKKLQENIEN